MRSAPTCRAHPALLSASPTHTVPMPDEPLPPGVPPDLPPIEEPPPPPVEPPVAVPLRA